MPLPAAKRSERGAESDCDCPVVTPRRAFGFDNLLGAQSRLASGWLWIAVGGGGVAGVAGAWACASAGIDSAAAVKVATSFVRITMQP